MPVKKSKTDRAVQFLPFSALKGLDETLREMENEVCNKKELSEEKCEELSRLVINLNKGANVRITHYSLSGYVVTECRFLDFSYSPSMLFTSAGKFNIEDIADIEIV